jgi:hypothetical protein
MEVKIGKGIVLSVDCEKLFTNDDVYDHIVYMGLRNVLMDSHASIKKEDEDFVAKSRAVAEKKLAALYRGEIRIAGERARLDPVEREARRMCLQQLQADVMAKGKKLNSITTDQWAKAMDATWEQYIPAAEQFLAAKATAPTIDLEALGL